MITNIHWIRFLIVLVFLVQLFSSLVQAQQIFTPNAALNKTLQSGKGNPTALIGVQKTKDGIIVNPQLRDGWTWIAVKDVLPEGSKPFNYFFYDGWLYTDKAIQTAHRRKKFDKDVTRLVQSDVFTIAFYDEKEIERELVVFIAAEKETQGELLLDAKIWGEEKHIPYHLQAGEGKFISMMKMSDEFRPYFFPSATAEARKISINKGWRFKKQDVKNGFKPDFKERDWEQVCIPHCWNAQDVHDQRNVFDGYEIFPGFYRGSGWYRKTFLTDVNPAAEKVFLEFEGANQVAEIWLNGKYIGKHLGGYTGFSFDISDAIHSGENLLAVKVDNSYNYDIPPHTADYIPYGGLYRDVRLKITAKQWIDDVYITTPKVAFDKANARIRTVIKNDGGKNVSARLVSNLVNNNGEIEATVHESMSIPAGGKTQFDQTTGNIPYPELWSPDNPYLYTLYSTLWVDGRIVEEKTTQMGFRWYRFDPNEGFFLNGHYMKLKGVNKHQDYAKMGFAAPDSLQVRDMEIIKEMGANFVRLSHYPHDPSVLEACDRLGIMVWAEIPVVNTVGGEKFKENAVQMMREMVRRDRSHASVIMWGVTNESAMPFTNHDQIAQVIAVLREIDKAAREEDPSRLTVQAHNHLDDTRISDITDVIGRNRYYGWYRGVMTDFEKVMAEEHAEHPGWNIIISEYGAGSKRGFHVENPKAWDFSEEFQLDFHEHYWKVINERPWIAGGCVWNTFDFGSSVKRGNIPRINQKGILDMLRRPKDLYYFYKSQWTEDPMVYVVSHTRRFYKGKPAEKKTIRVYSNCDEVELFVNGKSLGQKQNQYVFRWDVSLMPGDNHLKAVARNGDLVVTDQIKVKFLTEEEN